MFFFRKIWHALFSCNTCFEIRHFALLPRISSSLPVECLTSEKISEKSNRFCDIFVFLHFWD